MKRMTVALATPLRAGGAIFRQLAIIEPSRSEQVLIEMLRNTNAEAIGRDAIQGLQTR